MEVSGVNGGPHQFAFDAALALFVLAQDADRQSAQSSQVFGRIGSAGAALVFGENDIQNPVQLILYGPVAPHCPRKFLHVSPVPGSLAY